MRCLYPRTVGFKDDGKTISWSQKKYSKEYATFQLPCGKCIQCRLDYARQWAVRCMHESKMHKENSFITLTYSDEHLESPRLIYSHFQLFMMRLRTQRYEKFIKNYGEIAWSQLSKQEKKEKYASQEIGYFVTGEYGDEFKRPHWHAILFNYDPGDRIYKYSNKRGDRVYSSNTLDKLWGKGITELGSVTFESAGYCARYAAKKLNHGQDDQHDYHPISKKSSKHAIGKKWLETHWQDIFNYGKVILEDGRAVGSIPRYYEKWLLKNKPEEYERYVTLLKSERALNAQIKSDKEQKIRDKTNLKRGYKGALISKSLTEKIILEDKMKTLNSYRKGNKNDGNR